MVEAQLERAGSIRAVQVFVMLLCAALRASGETEPVQAPSACACPDGRQFSIGSSLFGRNSARIVITGFRRDLVQPIQQQDLTRCKDLMVVGQTMSLEVRGTHAFLRREERKRGTIEDICHTKIQFAEPKKSYDFFRDDGSAVTLSDMEVAQTVPENEASLNSEPAEDSDDGGKGDLTGKDLIRMMPAGQQTDDPGSSLFGAEDLKEGAYFMVRRQVKAAPAIDDPNRANATVRSNGERELTVWAGILGRIEKRAGFRNEPLWLVEVLPHSGPQPFSSYLRSMPATFRKHQPPERKFILASSDIVEINHFLDKYSLEWTRFGDESEEARKREFAGTTVLPEIYNAPQPALDDNLDNARKAGIDREIQAAAKRLVFSLKGSQPPDRWGFLVLDNENRPGTSATPHFFHKQCFVGEYQAVKTSSLGVFRVEEADLAIFQPRDSSQVPEDYYAVDLRLQLKSDAGTSMPIICRFPSAAIEGTLLDGAERILSSVFVIAPAPR